MAAEVPTRPACTITVDELVTHRQSVVGRRWLHVAEAGDGDDVVVLLHGFPDFWYSWRRQIPALVHGGYRVLAPDLRGYAGTDAPRGVRHYRLDRLVGDVVGLVAGVGAKRVTLVGHDWGGLLAWATAATHPDLVGRLAVCNVPHPRAYVRGLVTSDQLLRSWYAYLFQLPRLPERALAARDGALLRRVLRAGAEQPDSFSDDDLDRYVDALVRRGGLTGPLNYYRAAARGLPRHLVASARPVPQPVLVLWGDRDVALAPQLADPPPHLVPRARVLRFPDAGHWVHLDAADGVNDALLAFLSRSPTAGEVAATGQVRRPSS